VLTTPLVGVRDLEVPATIVGLLNSTEAGLCEGDRGTYKWVEAWQAGPRRAENLLNLWIGCVLA
jgi:hypothetical protein